MTTGGTEVLGRGGLGINVLALTLIVVSIVFNVLNALAPGSHLGAAVGGGMLFGAMATYGYLASTTSVQVRGDDLVLVGLLSVTRLPLPSVLRVSGEDGLEVTTTGGQTLTHMGYGSSVLGALTGNRRSNRVAARIRDALPVGGAPGSKGSTTRRPRPGLRLFAVVPLALSAVAAVIHQ